MRDGSHRAARERPNTIVHLLEQEAMQVREIAGNMESGNLTLPTSQMLVTGRETLQNETAMGWGAARRHNLLMRLVDAHLRRDLLDDLLLFIGERAMLLKLGNEWMCHARAPAKLKDRCS